MPLEDDFYVAIFTFFERALFILAKGIMHDCILQPKMLIKKLLIQSEQKQFENQNQSCQSNLT